MTGRDLIVFILENHLEDAVLFTDDHIPGLMSIEEAASKWCTGVHTLKALIKIGKVSGLEIGEKIYISCDHPNPFEVNKNER